MLKVTTELKSAGAAIGLIKPLILNDITELLKFPTISTLLALTLQLPEKSTKDIHCKLLIVKVLAKVNCILVGNWVDIEGLKLICKETG